MRQAILQLGRARLALSDEHATPVHKLVGEGCRHGLEQPASLLPRHLAAVQLLPAAHGDRPRPLGRPLGGGDGSDRHRERVHGLQRPPPHPQVQVWGVCGGGARGRRHSHLLRHPRDPAARVRVGGCEPQRGGLHVSGHGQGVQHTFPLLPAAHRIDPGAQHGALPGGHLRLCRRGGLPAAPLGPRLPLRRHIGPLDPDGRARQVPE
mmetsp:Transcript_3188/g.8123  ORF Transcript_3188/g.8123 Transcript_3188/m.8123 type:complete len:207 (+) Transcript_3188:1653-2273(+)